eukprot:CAMPEP_0171131592 /NCGR_PEP_ID=MMETSP0766_2-20121228/123018_1 /TAXON_ID=439317 /ORGANISM="Gambierdiscus australes, Strain CAWD 149" /LENGTH=99 /DNA_ID=CAMNT_0011594901 /DNA_START=96 /DNA_END=392 /DNA_ORIENTATION=+
MYKYPLATTAAAKLRRCFIGASDSQDKEPGAKHSTELCVSFIPHPPMTQMRPWLLIAAAAPHRAFIIGGSDVHLQFPMSKRSALHIMLVQSVPPHAKML